MAHTRYVASQSAEWINAARVLRRTGFGTTGTAVDAALAQGVAAHVSEVLGSNPDADPGAQSTPIPTFPKLTPPGKQALKADRQKYNSETAAQLETLTGWWMQRMVAVEQPLHEKLTLLWHNHFATSAQKVRNASTMAAQNQKLRTLGTGDFHTLVYSMLTDAATLRWLDGTENTAKAPNENLAREFMELFGLGHGNGYTETDVREGARALTGWAISADGSTHVVPQRQDRGVKTVLGVTGPLDAAGFCNAVLGHPASAGYVVGRMWQQLASDTPPSPATLNRVVDAYGPGRNLDTMVAAIVNDPEFAGSSIVNTPVEWLVGAVRALKVPVATPAQQTKLATVLRNLGQIPFYPPSVGGWPNGQAWLSTAGVDARMTAAAAFTKTSDLTPITSAAPRDRVDAVGYLLGIGAWSDRTATVLSTATADPPRLATIALNSPEYLSS